MSPTPPCRSRGSARSCARPTSSSRISNAVSTSLPAGMRSSMKAFSPTPTSPARRSGAPGLPRSGSPTTSITARPRSPARSCSSTGSALPIPGPAPKARPEVPPMNRPGIPPIILTWADRAYLAAFADDIAGLRREADIVVASCHWGLGEEVLDYMSEIAHAAVDAGADIVIGHGPHYSLPVEVYRGKPIFYGLGSFSFHTGHGGRRHGDWIGMMARVEIGPAGIGAAYFRFVRHNAANETVPCALVAEGATLDRIVAKSAPLGAHLTPEGDWVRLALPQ